MLMALCSREIWHAVAAAGLGICLAMTAGMAANDLSVVIGQDAKQRLRNLCGSDSVKLVFQNKTYLYMVDFSPDSPEVRRIEGLSVGTNESFLPVISPDGKWIAYATGARDDGTGVPRSTAWIRELALSGTPVKVADTGFVPRFVQKSSRDTLQIVYSTNEDCPAQLPVQPPRCDRAGMTLARKIALPSRVVSAPRVICGTGSYYGGLSRDERYLCTGWLASAFEPLMIDLHNLSGGPKGMHAVQVINPATVRDTVVALSGCNPSRSPSAIFTDAMMFLDFGTPRLQAFGAQYPALGLWGVHAALFISRYGTWTHGIDTRCYWPPAEVHVYDPEDPAVIGQGEIVGMEWNHPEWSNHPYFATASLVLTRVYFTGGNWTSIPRAERLYLIDLRDGGLVKLLEAADTTIMADISVKNPFLWVKVPSNFKEDSSWLAGVKLTPRPLSVLPSFASQSADGEVELSHGLLTSSSRISQVEVFSVLGQQIYRIRPQEPRSVRLSSYGPFRPGVYFINVELSGGRNAVLRWNVADR
jgi:hypothetical protein